MLSVDRSDRMPIGGETVWKLLPGIRSSTKGDTIFTTRKQLDTFIEMERKEESLWTQKMRNGKCEQRWRDAAGGGQQDVPAVGHFAC